MGPSAAEIAVSIFWIPAFDVDLQKQVWVSGRAGGRDAEPSDVNPSKHAHPPVSPDKRIRSPLCSPLIFKDCTL